MIEGASPVLPVKEVDAAVRWYVERLGFVLDWSGGRGANAVASVSRDGAALLLRAAGPAPPAGGGVALLRCVDPRGLDEMREAGLIELGEPSNRSWGYVAKFADPDGNELWVATEMRGDLPVDGGPAVAACAEPGRRRWTLD